MDSSENVRNDAPPELHRPHEVHSTPQHNDFMAPMSAEHRRNPHKEALVNEHHELHEPAEEHAILAPRYQGAIAKISEVRFSIWVISHYLTLSLYCPSGKTYRVANAESGGDEKGGKV